MGAQGYPIITKQDVADFSGRPVASYAPYVDTAIRQALLLFKLGTCLANLPDDEDKRELATFAILAMADELTLQQKYAETKANPFSSETIGSYSYSKKVQNDVKKGQETGVMWFDMALSQLSVCDKLDGVPNSGGINIFDRDGELFNQNDGYSDFVGPNDKYRHGFGNDVLFDPSGRIL